jgi:ribosomal protein L34
MCYECDFRTCDPSSLSRHRKRRHGHIGRTSDKEGKKNVITGGVEEERPEPGEGYITDMGWSVAAR